MEPTVLVQGLSDENGRYYHTDFKLTDAETVVELKGSPSLENPLPSRLGVNGQELCLRLFGSVQGIEKVRISQYQLTIYKKPAFAWKVMHPAIVGVLQDHLERYFGFHHLNVRVGNSFEDSRPYKE